MTGRSEKRAFTENFLELSGVFWNASRGILEDSERISEKVRSTGQDRPYFKFRRSEQPTPKTTTDMLPDVRRSPKSDESVTSAAEFAAALRDAQNPLGPGFTLPSTIPDDLEIPELSRSDLTQYTDLKPSDFAVPHPKLPKKPRKTRRISKKRNADTDLKEGAPKAGKIAKKTMGEILKDAPGLLNGQDSSLQIRVTSGVPPPSTMQVFRLPLGGGAGLTEYMPVFSIPPPVVNKRKEYMKMIYLNYATPIYVTLDGADFTTFGWQDPDFPLKYPKSRKITILSPDKEGPFSALKDLWDLSYVMTREQCNDPNFVDYSKVPIFLDPIDEGHRPLLRARMVDWTKIFPCDKKGNVTGKAINMVKRYAKVAVVLKYKGMVVNTESGKIAADLEVSTLKVYPGTIEGDKSPREDTPIMP